MRSVAISSSKPKHAQKTRFYERLSFEETFWGWLFIVPGHFGRALL